MQRAPAQKSSLNPLLWRQWVGEKNKRSMGGMDETTIKWQSRSKRYSTSLKLNDELILASEGVIKLHPV